MNVRLQDGAVSAESVREQLRLLRRLGYGGAAVARPVAWKMTIAQQAREKRLPSITHSK